MKKKIFFYLLVAFSIFYVLPPKAYAESQIYPYNSGTGPAYYYGATPTTCDGGQTWCYDSAPWVHSNLLETESDGATTYAQTSGGAWGGSSGACCLGPNWNTLEDTTRNYIPQAVTWAQQRIKMPAGIGTITRVKFYKIYHYWTTSATYKLQLYSYPSGALLYETPTQTVNVPGDQYFTTPLEFSNLNWSVTPGNSYYIRLVRTDSPANGVGLPVTSPCGATCTWYDNNGNPQYTDASKAPHSATDAYPDGMAYSGDPNNNLNTYFNGIAGNGGGADIAMMAVWGSLAAPSNAASACSIDGSKVTFSWNTVPGADSYLIRVNNDASYSPSWMDLNDFNVSLKGSYACSGTSCSFTSGPSSSPPNLNVSYCAINPCTSFSSGPSNIVTGELYDWNIQAIAPGESYPYSGARSGGGFTCTLPIPPTPSISANPSCIYTPNSGSEYTISWPAATPAITYIDISTDPNFGSFSNKYVAGVNSTNAPGGFSGLTLSPNTTYYVRSWNGYAHNNTPNPSFTTPTACTNPSISTLNINVNTSDSPPGVAAGTYGTSGLRSSESGGNQYNSLRITQNVAPGTSSSNIALVGAAFTSKASPPTSSSLYELTRSAFVGGNNGFVLLYAAQAANANYYTSSGGSASQSFAAKNYYVYFQGNWSPPVGVAINWYTPPEITVKVSPTSLSPTAPQFLVTLNKTIGSHKWGTYSYLMNNINNTPLEYSQSVTTPSP